VKLGAWTKRASSTLTVNVATPGVTPTAVAGSLDRMSVHGTGMMRPALEATNAASAQPTGLMTIFSMRPTGAPATSMTRAPSARRTTMGVVVVVTVVARGTGTTGVNGACAKPDVAANASPVAQSADLICVFFISNILSCWFVVDALSFSREKPSFYGSWLNWVLTPNPPKKPVNSLDVGCIWR
jgi:hypothetical protein